MDSVDPSVSSVAAPIAEPQHLRYVRSLTLPRGASGVACAVLDASVYAHAASASADDLRVFQALPHAGPRAMLQEIPFVVRYSGANPAGSQTATVRNRTLRHGDLSFDLEMPHRPYTQVDLQLAARNFLATAEVFGEGSGLAGEASTAKPLGVFALFDLTQQHLARSTSIPLQESTFPRLHIHLRLRGLDGRPLSGLTRFIVQGATVPASREAQTLYTVVATTGAVIEQGASSVAQLNVPAHLPIERVHVLLDPGYKADFLRTVSIVAEVDQHPAGESLTGEPLEIVNGELWRVTRAGSSPPIRASHLNIPAVLASNVHNPATIQVRVHNDDQPPLPIRAVQLEMRQRTLCFNATPGARYTLRYGDDALSPPVYDLEEPGDPEELGDLEELGNLAGLPAKPISATLGREDLNPSYIRRHTASTYDEHNPNRFWIVLIAAIAVLGTFVRKQTMREGRR